MLVHGKPSEKSPRRRRAAVVTVVVLCAASFGAGMWCYREGKIRQWHLTLGGFANRAAAMWHQDDVPVLRINIRRKHMAKIIQKREEAIRGDRLFTSSEDLVPATIVDGKRLVKIKMRLKGDGFDHWGGPEKGSYRIKVRDGEAVWGMRVFSLQHPRTRGWDREWLYHQALRREGVLALRYLFVRVMLNGKDEGIYALEEHFSKELLEDQQRREGVIVKLDESDYWRRRQVTGLQEADAGFMARPVWAAQGDQFRTSSVNASGELSLDRDAALQLLRAFLDGERSASEVFDVETTAKFLATAEFWSSRHSLSWSNLRFYYDPLAGRLEPIGFDACHEGEAQFQPDLYAPVMQIWSQALRDPAMAKAYTQHLARMSQPQYLRQLKTALKDEWDGTMLRLHGEWPGLESSIWSDLTAKAQYLRSIFKHPLIARADAAPTKKGTVPLERMTRLRVQNTTRLPVEWVGVHIAKTEKTPAQTISLAPRILPPATGDRPAPYGIADVALPADLNRRVFALCRLVGIEKPRKVPVRRFRFRLTDNPRPPAPTVEQALRNHPFLRKTKDAGAIAVAKGQWRVTGDLVLPKNITLQIGAGTTLRFDEGAILLAHGSLDLAGDEAAPIQLLPVGDRWAGVVVLDAPVSTWRHVEVRGTTGMNRPGWRMTGGVCFYRSPVRFERCRFSNNHGEDAVNVVRAKVTFSHCVFADTSSDAFDGDFVTAVFDECLFRDIGGDGIDVSGSRLRVNRTVLERIDDKAVSVGADSEAVLTELVVSEARMGIVSKDHSSVRVRRATIRNTRTALAAFVKKAEYAPPTLDAGQITFHNVAERAIVQTHSRVLLDGQTIDGREIDVKALYAKTLAK